MTPPWWYIPIKTPMVALKMIHAASQYRVRVFELGRCREERMRGTAGRRKRGSWCGMQDRSRVAEMAERRGRVVGFERRVDRRR